MRRVVLTALVLAIASTAHADAGAKLTLDREHIGVGEVAELSVSIEGAQDVPAPAVRVPDGLRIDYRGQTTSVSIVNGRMTATASHSYAVTAQRAGTYTIGPVRIDYDGRTIDAGVVRLVVSAGRRAAAQGDQPLRLIAEVSDRRVYLHQPLRLTLRLEVRGVRVTDLQYPTVTTDGLTIGGFPEPSQRRERRPGGAVDVVEFTTEVVPVRSGTLSLGPATMQLNVVVSGRTDPFFGSLFGSRKPQTLVADPVEIEVLPLPAEGRPPTFSGAVGRFTLDVTAKPTAVDAGDPVTFGVTVSGTGSLTQASAPAVPAAPGLKVYAPAEPESATRDGAVTTRRFEQVVIPERAGTVAIPPIEFSYFDPSVERYVTARGPDVVVTVRPRSDTGPDVVVGAPAPVPPAKPKELGRDIVFIKDDPGVLRPIEEPASRSAGFWALQLVPLLLLVAVDVWDRRRARFGADPRLGRFATAGATAKRALAAAGRSGEPDAVARAYTEYLCAKLDLAPGAVAPEAVRARLAKAGVGTDVIEEATGLLAACEHDRYRPSPGSAAGLLARAERVVAALERERRIVVPMLVVLVALGAVVTARAEAPKTLFFRGNALYADGHFEDAAAAWEAILADGLESGALHYNLGNARLRAGDRGHAILAYERAWRFIPGDADLMANLHFAKDDANPAEGMSLAARIAFPLAERVTTSRLVWWAAVAYWLLVGALIVGRLVPGGRRIANVAVFVSAVAFVTMAGAALYRHVRVDAPDWAVVLQDAEVRFEPAAIGTVHYDAPTGTVVEILAEREGWAQVARRSDGLRGWVERSAIETLRVPSRGA